VSGGDKFTGVPWHPAEIGGAPIIEGSLAWIDCKLELVHDAGDHELVIGKVLELGLGEGEPLLYYRSGFAHLTPLGPG
jgi:3-hydroxy-9,10-secoandrosta-1,3,5(10)-triene-9,17-dione monooxygenase reductase component